MKIENSLGYLLNTGAKLVKRELDNHLKEHHITTAQWATLKFLSEKGERSQAEIALGLNSDRATSGAVIEKLAVKGLIEKETSLQDRRSYRVSLTKAGLQLVGAVTGLAQQVNMQAVAGLDERELACFTKCLHAVILNLGE